MVQGWSIKCPKKTKARGSEACLYGHLRILSAHGDINIITNEKLIVEIKKHGYKIEV